jgi:hypothetical protein
MKKAFLSGFFVSFIFIFMIPFSSAFAEETVKVEVKNEQGGEVRPDLDTAKVELTFKNIQSGSAHILLSSPERKFFSPTDFPMVEGTKLIDTTLSVEKGKATFTYMFPIRGDYHMNVEVFDEKGNSVGIYKPIININENPAEVKNAIIFIVILAVFGFVAGFVLAKRRKNSYAV